MRILFCNIGWMERYNGNDNDEIQRGGSYNNDAVGYEVCNFTNDNEFVYGYVRSHGQIKIERIGAKKNDEKIDDVIVVWLASPKTGGTVVVGWYNHATVFRHEQKSNKKSIRYNNHGIELFLIKAAWKDAFLLPVNNRDTLIPRAIKGGIGQSNVWYADSPESKQYVERVLNLINRNINNAIADIDQEIIGTEGNPRFISHIRKERNKEIIQEKKRNVLMKKGCLSCEVCGFDFFNFYGEDGKDFCEVHHLTPLHQCDGEVNTKLSDLAIVCSNCHRIIHKTNPMITIENLSKKIKVRK